MLTHSHTNIHTHTSTVREREIAIIFMPLFVFSLFRRCTRQFYYLKRVSDIVVIVVVVVADVAGVHGVAAPAIVVARFAVTVAIVTAAIIIFVLKFFMRLTFYKATRGEQSNRATVMY